MSRKSKDSSGKSTKEPIGTGEDTNDCSASLSLIADKISKLLSRNLQAETAPKDWRNLDGLADWLERKLVEGKGRAWMAVQLGVPVEIIADLIHKVVDQKRLKDLFDVRKSMIRAEVLAHGEEIVDKLVNSMKYQSNAETTLKVAEILMKFMDLKEPDAKALVQINVHPEPKILERYEVLDAITGQAIGGGPSESQHYPQLERQSGAAGTDDSQV